MCPYFQESVIVTTDSMPRRKASVTVAAIFPSALELPIGGQSLSIKSAAFFCAVPFVMPRCSAHSGYVNPLHTSNKNFEREGGSPIQARLSILYPPWISTISNCFGFFLEPGEDVSSRILFLSSSLLKISIHDFPEIAIR